MSMIDGFVLWGEKLSGKGEDCIPIRKLSSNNCKGILCVCDGMGGAGSAIYEHNNTKQSGAAIAANECKYLIESSSNIILEDPEFKCNEFIKCFEIEIVKKLSELSLQNEPIQSRIKSNLIRRFPTTIAGVLYVIKENEFDSFCFWAGDSRCYELNPEYGLIQISIDDLRVRSDSYDKINEDSPLSNYINADVGFTINTKKIKNSLPSIIFTCTDGVYGYFRNPYSFEYHFLETLMISFNEDEWKVNIENVIKKITGDDFSLSLSFLGFNNFNELKDRYQERFDKVKNDYFEPFNDALSELEFHHQNYQSSIKVKNELEQKLWNLYKLNYEFKYD